jgi:hypothetical protein
VANSFIEADVPGIGRIKIENAAQESTLLDILAAIEKTNKAKTTQQTDEKNAQRKAKKSIEDQTRATRDATNTIERFDREYLEATTTVTNFGSVLTDVTSESAATLRDLSSSIASGANEFESVSEITNIVVSRMTELISATGKMVGGISILGTNIKGLAEGAASTVNTLVTSAAAVSGFFLAQLENMSSTMNELSQRGAGFSGQLIDMRETALRANLTLDQFSGLVNKRSNDLATIGGTVTEGAKVLSSVIDGIPKQQREALLRMGYTYEEIADSVTEYTRQNTMGLHKQNYNIAMLSQGSFSYLKNLRELSALTGEDADEIKARQKQFRDQATMRAKVLELESRGVSGVRENLGQLSAIFGSIAPEFEKYLTDIIAGDGAVSVEGAIVEQAYGPLADVMREFALKLQAGVNPDQFASELKSRLQSTVSVADKYMRDNASTVALAQFSDNRLLQTYQSTFTGVLDSLDRFRTGLETAQAEAVASIEAPDELNKAVVSARLELRDLYFQIQETITDAMESGQAIITGPINMTKYLVEGFNTQLENLVSIASVIESSRDADGNVDLEKLYERLKEIGLIPGKSDTTKMSNAELSSLQPGESLRGQQFDDNKYTVENFENIHSGSISLIPADTPRHADIDSMVTELRSELKTASAKEVAILREETTKAFGAMLEKLQAEQNAIAVEMRRWKSEPARYNALLKKLDETRSTSDHLIQQQVELLQQIQKHVKSTADASDKLVRTAN